MVGDVIIYCPSGSEVAVFTDGKMVRAGHLQSCPCMREDDPAPERPQGLGGRHVGDGLTTCPPGLLPRPSKAQAASDEASEEPAAEEETPAPSPQRDYSDQERLALMLRAAEESGDPALIALARAEQGLPEEDTPPETAAETAPEVEPEPAPMELPGTQTALSVLSTIPRQKAPTGRRRMVGSMIRTAAVALAIPALVQVVLTSATVRNTG
jgi:hypothetical protein